MISTVHNTNAVSAPADVLAALHQASATTGSDFDYLLGTAMRESSLQTQVKSKTSSATGLFQFIDQTWLGLVKRFGNQHGLGQYAAAIEKADDGRYTVASADMKAAILALRKDPKAAALMAGEAAQETRDNMQDSLGRDVSCGELYAAHFLGEGGACKLIALKENNPNQRADVAFPQAAKANRSVFYHADGSAKSVGEVYAWAATLPGAAGAASATPKSSPTVATAADSSTHNAAFTPILDNPQTRSESSGGLRHERMSDAAPKQSARPLLRLNPESMTAIASRTLPQSPLVLTPGVIEILSSMNVGTPSLRRSM
jgi:hypothetical protein